MVNKIKGVLIMNKKYLIPTLFSLVALTGCQSALPDEENHSPIIEGSIECWDNQAVYEQLLFGETGKTIAYDGYAEYGHLLTLERIDKAEGEDTIYVYRGSMNDGVGDVDETRRFDLTYTLTQDELIETITNHDPLRQHEDVALLNSIIPNKVVLKGNLKTGSTWEESFEYKGQTYTAINQLTVQTSETGRTQYRVDTRVENIPGFVDRTYTETRVFEEGLGLVSFSNIQPLDFFDSNYQSEYNETEFYQFGYSRTGEISEYPE